MSNHPGAAVRVAGVDLAAEAAGTALAVLRVDAGQGGPGTGESGQRAAGQGGSGTVVLDHLRLGVDDETLLAETRDAPLIGIDCAFGWPVDFVDFVARQAGGARLTSDDTGDLAWRRRLAHRETDRVVTERTGARPLSVATDRLGMTALRCAVLLDRLAGYAVTYYQDFVKPAKKYRAPSEQERAAIEDLAGRIDALPAEADAEAIQDEVYAVGKEHGFEPLRAWFQALYEVLLGQETGPRFGSFVALYGRAETLALMRGMLKGNAA